MWFKSVVLGKLTGVSKSGKMPTVKPNERRVALLKDLVCECMHMYASLRIKF